jgi:PIN domain nuclease of toxin-antitoxin system
VGSGAMIKPLLLDTHVWIWFANGDAALQKSLRKTINQAAQDHLLNIAAISLWEVAMLEKRKRIILEMPCLEWIKRSIELMKIQIVPLTPEISVESCHLPGHFHGDPSDQLIVASARNESLVLVTRDKNILKYAQQKYISCLIA